MKSNVFEYSEYQPYLKDALDPKIKRGQRALLAKTLNCQTSFISQVLSGRSHFSIEHALKIANFLNLTKIETDYFVILVQKEKAGTVELRNYFEEQLQALLSDRNEVREAIGNTDEVSEDHYNEYYSNWWYAAIHIATALPKIESARDVSSYLSLPFALVDQSLEFLIKCGLVKYDAKGRLQIGKMRIHIGSQSPLVHSHHCNWRLKAMNDLSQNSADDIHFTGVLGLSQKDGQKLRALFLELIKKSEPIIRDSKDEDLFVMLLDFYPMSKT